MKPATNYFDSRTHAGVLLGEKLMHLRYDDTIILALNEGGVVVGAEIAKQLHSLIAMLLTKDVYLPDGRTLVGVVNEVGGFVYNDAFSSGEIEELELEYRQHIESAKFKALHELHVALGQGGLISKEYFRNRTVIVVSDNAFNGLSFNMAADFLKAVKIKRMVFVAPIATVKAVDRMHVLADEIACLSVTEQPFDVNHYYENSDLPDRQEIFEILNNIILDWQIASQVPKELEK